MIIRRRSFKPTSVTPLFDPSDDFSTNDTVKWGGTAPTSGTVDLGQKWSKFWYDPSSDFGFTVDTVNLNRGFFAGGANGSSPVNIELLDGENGSVIGTHAVGIMVHNSSGENMYAWSNSESHQLLTSANIGSSFDCQFVCSWDSGTNIFTVDVNPSTGGTYQVATSAQAPSGDVWVMIRIDDIGSFAESELDEFTGNGGSVSI